MATIAYGIFVVPLIFIHFNSGYDLAKGWGKAVIWLAKVICGIDYWVKGRENMPAYPCVSMAKHQSAWETVFILTLLPRAVWIIKREMVWVPVIGWVLYALQSIAIDRKSGKRAIEQIEEQGRERISRGLWVSIFPEAGRTWPLWDRRGLAGGENGHTHIAHRAQRGRMLAAQCLYEISGQDYREYWPADYYLGTRTVGSDRRCRELD